MHCSANPCSWRARSSRRWSGSTADRKSTRLNSSHSQISYAVFCLKKKNRRRGAATGQQGPPERPQRLDERHCKGQVLPDDGRAVRDDHLMLGEASTGRLHVSFIFL